MSRTTALLTAVADLVRGMPTPQGEPAFRDVRVELDRYELAKMADETFQAPAARVCFLAGKSVPRTDRGLDRDVSIAIVVIAGREGRADTRFASADIAAMERLDWLTEAFLATPYVGLTRLGAAQIGDQMVAVSEASNKKGVCIALIEVTFRLHEVAIARPAIQRGIETGRLPYAPSGLSLNDGPSIPAPPATGGGA
jgi:hypothetical protein